MQKIKAWLLARFPWALQQHYHHDPTLLKYGVCGRCGHMILTGHVQNHRVTINAWGMTWGDVYAKGCDPGFDHLELAPDRTVHAYVSSEIGRTELAPEDMTSIGLEEFERLKERMLAEVAHLQGS